MVDLGDSRNSGESGFIERKIIRRRRWRRLLQSHPWRFRHGGQALLANLLALGFGHVARLPDAPRSRARVQAGPSRRGGQRNHHRQQEKYTDRQEPPRAEEKSRHACEKICQRSFENFPSLECHRLDRRATSFARGPVYRFHATRGQAAPIARLPMMKRR